MIQKSSTGVLRSHATTCLLIIIAIASFFTSCKKPETEPVLKITTLASGLAGPIGLELDKKGRVWVAESGTTKNDGKVTVITPDGKKYPVIINLGSILSEGGEPEGPAHILLSEGILYILGAEGKMYKADVSNYNVGDAPKAASTLAVENIGDFVLKYPFKSNTHMTHPYNLTLGPNGSIYITDAAANAILKRERTGALSVVSEVPGFPNPLFPVGPPQVESVPTGIYYDGQNFLITTLNGFPFPAGKAVIYQMTPSGVLSIYQSGFTTLVDIAEGGIKGRLVLQHGVFALPTGFGANTGRLIWTNGTSQTLLAEGLNQPAGLKQEDAHTWYVSSVADGTVLKIEY